MPGNSDLELSARRFGCMGIGFGDGPATSRESPQLTWPGDEPTNSTGPDQQSETAPARLLADPNVST